MSEQLITARFYHESKHHVTPEVGRPVHIVKTIRLGSQDTVDAWFKMLHETNPPPRGWNLIVTLMPDSY